MYRVPALHRIVPNRCLDQIERLGVWRAKRREDLVWVEALASKPAQELKKDIQRCFGRSLHIRHVDAGSCNGCESELQALNNPYYNLHRLGIFFTPSPRFADLLLVTGSVTYAMREPLLETYNAMPEPRWVMAMGTCAVSGGATGGGYSCGHGVEGILPVDIYVPGCPAKSGSHDPGAASAAQPLHAVRPGRPLCKVTCYWRWRCSGASRSWLLCLNQVGGWRVLELCSDVAAGIAGCLMNLHGAMPALFIRLPCERHPGAVSPGRWRFLAVALWAYSGTLRRRPKHNGIFAGRQGDTGWRGSRSLCLEHSESSVCRMPCPS